eukprot:g16978.t1
MSASVVASIGWVGLGRMGAPMASQIARKLPQHPLRVFDVCQTARENFQNAKSCPNLRVCSQLAELRDCNVVFMSVPTSREVVHVTGQLYDLDEGDLKKRVLSEPEEDEEPPGAAGAGVGAEEAEGSSDNGLIDVFSTSNCNSSGDYGTIKRLENYIAAASTREPKISLVDCPVSGGPRGAAAGTLTAMIGGAQTDSPLHNLIDPLIACFAESNRFYLGAHSLFSITRHAVKSINNALNATNLITATEGLRALQNIGVPKQTALEAVNKSSGRSLQSEVRIVEEVLTGRYGYGFSFELMWKDLRQARKLFDSISKDLRKTQDNYDKFILPQAEKVFEAAAAGLGSDIVKEDYTRVAQYILENDDAGNGEKMPPEKELPSQPAATQRLQKARPL